MKSKSQVSLFIIVGLVLLFVFGILFYISSILNIQNDSDSSTFTVEQFIESCVDEVSEKGILLLGLQNGIALNDYAERDKYKINYALIDNVSHALSIEDMQEQLKGYVESELPKCIDEFNDFKQYNIEYGSPTAAVQINKRDVTFIVDYDVQVMIGKTHSMLHEFSTVVPVRLSKIQQAVEYVTTVPKTKIELYEYLGTLDINTTVYPNEEGMIYILSDEKSLIDTIPYKYAFAIK